MLPAGPLYERRYPYLDRDLLEFVYAIPREQIVRPHQRRSLMRRALRGIVSEEVLSRRRKASVSRTPMVAVSSQWRKVYAMTEQMEAESLGIVDRRKFIEFLSRVRDGQESRIVPVLRTLTIESWLRHLKHTTVGSGAEIPFDCEYPHFEGLPPDIRFASRRSSDQEIAS